MSIGNLERTTAAERAALVSRVRYRVQLDLRTPREPHFACRSEVEFDCAQPGAASFLDFVGHSVDALVVNGTAVEITADAAAEIARSGRIPLADLAEHNHVVVEATAVFNSDGIGLHRMVDPVDDEVYVYTQFEPAEAKRAFPCFDQPDLKATWSLHVEAPAGWEVVSNGPVESRPEPGEAGLWVFGELPPIATYVLGLVGGNYHRVDDAHNGVPLGVLCRQSLAEYLDSDEIFDITKAGLDLYADLFGCAYPFPKYDQIWVPEFNWGAMENVGCVTFTERTLFRSRVTEAERETRADTILHELAHMWFGNLVTMRWWDDLWLNESFATFMATHALVRATRFTDAWALFQGREKAWAYRQDQLPSTHPIAADVVDTDAVSSQFDGITYAKGASVLRQLVAWVGEEQFFAGVKEYFAQHAWGNTTLRDFLGALERASGRDLAAWSADWLQTAGVNTMQLTGSGLRELGQSAPAEWPTLRSHRIRVGRYEVVADALERTGQVECDVAGSSSIVPEFTPTSAAPALVLLNDDDLAYTKVRLDSASRELLQSHLQTVRSPLTRALLWGAAWDATRDAEWRPNVLVDLVARHAPAEGAIGVLTPLLGHATTAIESLSAPEHRGSRRSYLAATAWQQAQDQRDGSDAQLAWFRVFLRSARSAETLPQLLDVLADKAPPGITVDNDVRWATLISLAERPEVGDAQFEALLAAETERDKTDEGQRRALTARASRPSAAAKAAAWSEALDGTVLTRREAALSGLWNNEQPELVAPYVDRYFAVVAKWAELPGETGLRLIEAAFPHALPSADLVARAQQLADHASPAVARVLREEADGVARVLRCRASDAEAN